MIFSPLKASPWGEPYIDRPRALKLLDISAQALDQLGLRCAFVSSDNPEGFSVVYEPSMFAAVMARMRAEIEEMKRATEAIEGENRKLAEGPMTVH